MNSRRAGRRRVPPAAPRHRQSASRQRQRLIDACISALHIYGPSRTTVAKVVAIAKLSPGIVRFYFKSKGAMLVASLRFLATEFEQLVLEPVGRLRDTPVQALERLVELYLDPAVASTRKVSVWYAFWGEATARQEYQDICGQKDDRFADLVLELVGRMIEQSRLPHLDADAISLGLIGVLEVLWQGFAFQAEEAIDRAAARRRCMAYLASVFPGHFPAPGGVLAWDRLPAERRHAEELARCFAHAWQLVGHAQELRSHGDYLTLELATGRALVVRDHGEVRALANSCPHQPHALLMQRSGRLPGPIACPLHRLSFALDGAAQTPVGGAQLAALRLAIAAELVFVAADGAAPSPLLPDGAASALAREVTGMVDEVEVAADWKVAVEQLLLHRMPEDEGQGGAAGPTALEVAASIRQLRWRAMPASGTSATAAPWQRVYLWPNILLEWRAGGIDAVQVMPLAPGRSRWLCHKYRYGQGVADGSIPAPSADQADEAALRLDIDLAASTQRGISTPGFSAVRQANAPRAVAFFRQLLEERLRQG